MSRLRRARRALGLVAEVTARRARHGPLQPGWPWRYEVVMAYVRTTFRRPASDLSRTRARMDALGARERARGRVRWRDVTAGGRPATWAEPHDPRHPGEVLLYLHGGGYAFGSVDSHARLIADLARVTGRSVLALEYRLAPEHPCPAAIRDVVSALRWIRSEVTPDRLVIAGDSAGGGLALAAMAALRDEGAEQPDAAVLLSPWTDLTVSGASVDRFDDIDYLGTRDGLFRFARHYVGTMDRDDPRVSPLYQDHRQLPSTLVLAGGAEVLLDDSLRLVERMEADGVEVRIHVEPGEVHVYPAFPGLSPHAADALARIARFLDDVQYPSVPVGE